MNEHHLIADWHNMQPKLHEQGSRVDTETVVLSLKQMAYAIGGNVRLHAVVSEEDEVARKAFEKERFRVWSVNGDRRRELERLKEEVEDDVLGGSTDCRLTLVTTDPTLEGLARRAMKVGCQVRVWGTAMNTPSELRQYNFQPLEDLLPELRIKRVVVLIDWENISISLEKAGWVVNPETAAETFKHKASQYGQVHAIYAYADWGALAKSMDRDVQRLLEMAGVATRYEISMRGKSSSDMRIVDKAHKLLQGSDAPDVLVLATGDRDFRALIETARRRFGKTVVLWGKKGTVSPMVSEIVDAVEWVDDFLPLPNQRDLQSINHSMSDSKNALVDPFVELALRTERLLQSRGWEWTSSGLLLNALVSSEDPNARSAAWDQIQQAKAKGVLLSEQKQNPHPNATTSTIEAYSLNADHPSVKAVRLVIRRVQDRLRYALEVRRMPWVSYSYIANGMGMDTELKKAGLVRTREEQMRWLNLLVEEGFLIKERQTSPQNCTVLWLPNKTSAKGDDPETMVRRLITAMDACMAQYRSEWVGMKWLHQHLEPFGNTVFQETVERLTKTGEAEQRYHDSPKGSHSILGLQLGDQGATVAGIRNERKRVLAILSEMAEDNEPVSIKRLQAHLEGELQPNLCGRWVEVLADEKVVQGQGDTYYLNRDHPLLAQQQDNHPQPQNDDPPLAFSSIESNRLRQMVTDALTDEEVTSLTYDYFRPVYELFSEGMSKSKKIHKLVEYVERKGVVELLLSSIQDLNPTRVAQRVPLMAAA